jgi:ABC-type cobalamin/Fe3+-siderophores transport system ATPase subunit
MDKIIQIPSLKQSGDYGYLNFSGAMLPLGQCVAIAGRNGAGKSVLLKSILANISMPVGWVSNYREPFLDMRVQEVIEIVQLHYNKEKTLQILQDFQLMPLQNQSVNVLSDGEFMRLMLARVTAQDPMLMLMDEPDAHLDFYFKAELKFTVERWSKKGKVILYSTHDEQWVRQAHQCWWVDKGVVQTENPMDFDFQKIGNNERVKTETTTLEK